MNGRHRWSGGNVCSAAFRPLLNRYPYIRNTLSHPSLIVQGFLQIGREQRVFCYKAV